MTEMQLMNLSRLLRLQREAIDKNTESINKLAEAVIKLSEARENIGRCK